MVLLPAEIASGLPFVVSLALAGGISSLREARRRSVLNEAVHELRRPLQALALAAEGSTGEAVHSSLRMAMVALRRLDLAINGEGETAVQRPVSISSLVAGAAVRWQPRAEAANRSLRLCWPERPMTVAGDPFELGQALDNLITNAIEHGSGEVVVEGSASSGHLRLVVRDSGQGGSRRRRWRLPGIGRIGGRARDGHGLRVVRRVASAHGGSFRLNPKRSGTEAVLRLPLCGSGHASAAWGGRA